MCVWKVFVTKRYINSVMLNSTTRSAKAAIAWAGSDIVVHFFIPDEELEDVIYDDDDDEGQ